jgi:hypothetical protein
MKRRKRSNSSGLIFRVVRTATNIRTGEKSVTRFGAYTTRAEARAWLEQDKEASPGPLAKYQYEYEIEGVSREDR